jgi:hypothetical protein
LTETTFADFGLAENILKAVLESGYTIPTPIQREAIPHILMGGDVTGIAQTGTGKTAAFVLPMIQRLSTGRARARMPRCLILCPTRELAAQVAENFEKYGKHLKLTMALLIGGVSFKDQEALLQRGVDVLIATPGRLMDQFDRGKMLLMGVETLIIDEADRMLDMGFIPDIEKICSKLPASRQTLLFSATFPTDIQRLAKTFQKDPKKIEVTRPTDAAQTITQHVVHLPTNDGKARRTALRRVIEASGERLKVVFDTPVQIRGTALLSYSYEDRPDDQWLYLPAMSRVKRIASRNKSGPFLSSEFAFEDMMLQELDKFSYRLEGLEPCGEARCWTSARASIRPGWPHGVRWRMSGWCRTTAMNGCCRCSRSPGSSAR